MAEDPKVTQLAQTFDTLKSDRNALDQELQQIAYYVCPERAFMYQQQSPNGDAYTSNKPPYVIIDEPQEANLTLAHGLYTNICPPNMQFYALESNESDENEEEDTQDFFATAGLKMYNAMMNSNFAMQMNEGFQDIGWTGNICVYVEEDPERILSFTNIPWEEFYAREDHRGKIDTVFRSMKLTALQVFTKFQQENDKLPDRITEQAKSPDPVKNQTKYTIIHAVMPNYEIKYDERGLPLAGNKNKPFKSYYFVYDSKEMIREAGYDFQPYTVARFIKKCRSIYGFSPARRAFRSMKILNRMTISTLKTVEKGVDPVVNIDSAGYDKKSLSPEYYTNPSSVNVYNGAIGKPPTYQPVPNIDQTALTFSDRYTTQINRAFYADMFQMINQLNQQGLGRQRTAFEIQQLVSERQSMIVPIVSRILEELFTPLIKKCYLICEKRGLFPPKPDSLKSFNDMNIVYVSPLALSTRMGEINNANSAIQTLIPLGQIYPDIFDILNSDKFGEGVFRDSGVNPMFFRNEYELRKFREDKANRQAQAQAQAQASELAKSQTLTDPVAPDSAIGALARGGIG